MGEVVILDVPIQKDKASAEGPLISVAMPFYNARQYLRCSVNSILKQTESRFELILIDDGSTDGSLEMIRDMHDKRIRILCDGVNKGLAWRLNEAIEMARGRYFARMDSDDVSFPMRFAKQMEALEQDKDLDLISCGTLLIDDNNNPLGIFPSAKIHSEICAYPWRGFYMPHPGWMGRTEWFRRFRYAVPGPYCSEDQELLLRSYEQSKFATLPECLLAYRIDRRIRFEKLFFTRLAILKFQAKHFLKSGRILFMFLATATFFLKTAMDILKKMRHRPLFSTGEIIDEKIRFSAEKILRECE